MAKKRWLVGACGGALLAGGLGGLQSSAFADLTLDLRLVSKNGAALSDPKAVTVASGDVGANFVLDLFAIVTEESASPSVGFSSVGGSFLSTGAPVKGTIAPNGTANASGPQVGVTGFNDLGSQPGASTDLDGDGDLDRGSVNSDNLDNFVFIRDQGRGAGLPSTVVPGGRQWRIGSISFTLTSVGASGSSTLNFAPQRDAAGQLTENTALWFESTAITPGNPSGSLTPVDPGAFLDLGAPVTFSVIGVVFTEWISPNGGAWTNAANWTAGGTIPSGDGAIARFHGANTTNNAPVTVDAGRTVGVISFDDSNPYLLSGGSLTLSNGGAPGQINLVTGSHTINTPITAANGVTISGSGNLTAGDITNNGPMAVNTNVTANNISGTGTTTVAAAKTLTANHVRQAGLTVNGTTAIKPNGTDAGTSDVNSLTIAGVTDGWTGKLDIADNDMVIRTAGGAAGDTAYANALNQAKTGLNESGGVFWGGNGITSSTAAANAGGVLTAVGIILNDFAEAGLPAGPIVTEFSGRTVTQNDILVKYTYFGDADLSGVVDGTDYFLIDQAFSAGMLDGGWLNGDFNYDGKVDGTDYFLIDNAFGAQGAPLSGLGASAVPEPTVFAALTVAGLGLLTRRRRTK